MKKNKTFGMIIIGLTVLIVLTVAKTAECQSYAAEQNNEAYYVLLEKEYVEQVRNYLNEAGYSNSGVMLTRVINEEGEREYTMAIHHRRMEKLSGEEKEELIQQLAERAFEEKGCSFVYSLTGNA